MCNAEEERSMSTVDHPIGLNLEENKAFHEKAWSHIVGVVNLKENADASSRTRWEGLGTGCACSWRGRALILTARHVVDGAEESDLAFLPRSGTALGWESPGKLGQMVERVRVGSDRIIRCEWEDLAAILLNPHGLEALNVEFCELPGRLASGEVRGPGSVLVVGYPVDQTFEVSESKSPSNVTKLLACPCDSFWGDVVEQPSCALDSSYDASRHLLVRFEPAAKGRKPHGYSGAAVWCDPVRRAALWTPSPLLAGVQTHGYTRAGLVRAVRSSAIRKFLEEGSF
jgi:hypothetical protein